MSLPNTRNFVRHLINLEENEVEYNFDEIEKILGFSLPDSAKIFRPWWSNDKTHVQARDGWMKAGWDVIFIDLNEEIVRFRRKENFSPHKYIMATRQVTIEEMSPADFEIIAREVMSKHYKQDLSSVEQSFDICSLRSTP